MTAAIASATAAVPTATPAVVACAMPIVEPAVPRVVRMPDVARVVAAETDGGTTRQVADENLHGEVADQRPKRYASEERSGERAQRPRLDLRRADDAADRDAREEPAERASAPILRDGGHAVLLELRAAMASKTPPTERNQS